MYNTKKYLGSIFNLDNIDWNQAWVNSQKNKCLEAWNLWQYDNKSVKEICEILKLSDTTVGKYLERGNKHRNINYTKEESNKRKGRHTLGLNNINATPVICLTTKRIFTTIASASSFYKISNTNINKSCKARISVIISGTLENGEKLIWRYLNYKSVHRYKFNGSLTHNTGRNCIHFPKTKKLKSQQFIEENYNGDIALDLYAKLDEININYHSTYFTLQTGLTPREYLKKVRVDKSKEFLLKTKYSISRIAKLVGYNTAQRFTKVFMEFENISPNEFRENNFFRRENSPLIICLTTKKIFPNEAKAMAYYGTPKHILECCKKEYGRKTCGKLSDGTPLVWRYLNLNPKVKYRVKR